MEREKISIIIAVYKAEQYLDKCINSVVNQTYKNLEILLVDDGSPDNCPKMCDDWAQKDNRIKVIHKTNGGVSSAWNAGLDNATGEYIAFVDSDDWVDNKYVEELYNALKKHNCDMSICSNYIVKNNVVKPDKKYFCFGVDSYYDAANCLSVFWNKKYWRHTTWGKLYKKTIFNNIRYPEDIRCTEDTYIIYDICQNIKNGIVTISKPLYYYVIHNKSVGRIIDEKRLDWIKSKRHVLESLNPAGAEYKYASTHLFLAYKKTYNSFKKFKRKDLIKELNELLKEDYKKYITYTSGSDKIMTKIFRYNRPLYDIIHITLGKLRR